MSNQGAPFSQGSAETGETVASFTQYEGAQKAVSALIAAEVPAKEIAIVGAGLRSIERITGRLGYATAARSGAINGLMLGVLFSFIFVLGAPTVQIQAFVGVLLVGIAIGMLLNILMFSIVRRRRDYASVMQVVADHYEVKVAPTSVHKARTALGTAPTATRPSSAAPRSDAPPRYGERITPGSPSPQTPPVERPTTPGPQPGQDDDRA